MVSSGHERNVQKFGERKMEYEDREAQDPASLSFPVGLVLLLTFLFCMCCFFSCCLHWEKLRYLLGCSDQPDHRNSPPLPPQSAAFSPPDKTLPLHTIWKEKRPQNLSVLMPGDEVPRFIATACPPCAAATTTALVEVIIQKQSISDSSRA